MDENTVEKKSKNFIEHMIDKDIKEGRCRQIVTRFPPEPNGYLHIGHAKAILTNYMIAETYNGKFNLRFDDTDPSKDKMEYVEAIKEDLLWLGADYEDRLFFASSYFDKLYECAIDLIKKGKAYVCDLSPDEMRTYRGTLTEPGIDSPYRNRSVDENIDLFERMKCGEFKDGMRILRAKIDMTSPNMNMRDPGIYRISHLEHYASGDKWCVYPLYDFAHPIEDAIEGISHSMCGIEFEDHRPLYDWVLEMLEWPNPPRQIEFAELDISHTIIGKRKIRPLIEEGLIDGWDDPRLATIRGLKRRGYTKEAIRSFFKAIGLSKSKSKVDIAMLEHALREDLKLKAPRLMTVLDPIKVIITNYEEGAIEYLEMINNNENEALGSRQIPFTRELYIEKEDFIEVAPNRKYKRLVLGDEVRLMHAYFIRCNDIIRDEHGTITELHCTYDIKTKSGSGFKERKPRGTIHWVSAKVNEPIIVKHYAYLFTDNEEGESVFNADSITLFNNAYSEIALKEYAVDSKFQFVRHGYYNIDPQTSTVEKKVLNQAVSLKSSYRIKK